MRILHLLAQVVGTALLLLGLYMLAGMAWAVLAAGLGLLVGSTLVELAEARAGSRGGA